MRGVWAVGGVCPPSDFGRSTCPPKFLDFATCLIVAMLLQLCIGSIIVIAAILDGYAVAMLCYGSYTLAALLWQLYIGSSAMAAIRWQLCYGGSAMATLLWRLFYGGSAMAALLCTLCTHAFTQSICR